MGARRLIHRRQKRVLLQDARDLRRCRRDEARDACRLRQLHKARPTFTHALQACGLTGQHQAWGRCGLFPLEGLKVAVDVQAHSVEDPAR